MRRPRPHVAGFIALCFVAPIPGLVAAQDPEERPELGAPMLALEEELIELGVAPEVASERVREAARAGLLGPIELPPEEPDETATPVSLPVGGPRSAATPQALPMPDGEGSIQGMGESFSPSLSSGTLSFSVPIALPAGRAGVAPSLVLGYSSAGGSSVAGFGWSLGVAAIARQTDRGLPRYLDGSAWHPEEDRFVYAGSHELVPVDSSIMSALDGGEVPSELAGWQQYRSQVEGSFLRFFRSPDSARWVVQSPDGTRHELGLLGDGPNEATDSSSASLVTDGSRIASWALTRTSDVHGSTIYYTYETHQGEQYLTDVHYLSPASCDAGTAAARRRCAQPLSRYGARAHIVYEDRPDPTISFRTGWRIRSARRIRRIEVTAAGDDAGTRFLVRRYHFAYDARSYHSLLSSITVEGRPEAPHPFGVVVGNTTVPESSLGETLIGPTLPPMRFRYSGEQQRLRGVGGFPALDRTRRRGASSPAHGVGDARADLFDVNSDGLVDVLVTDPSRFRASDGSGAVGVYFNGFSGRSAAPASAGTFSEPVVVPVPSTYADSMQLNNPNIVPMDVDGDGRSDLLHLPRVASYGFFTPVRNAGNQASPAAQGWRFAYLDVDATSDPRIDLSRDAERTRALDVNADGLVDVVRTTGTSIQTWLNLGWYPGGEGRFGSASFVRGGGTGGIPSPGGGQWVLTADPVESCLPWAGSPVSFDDPEIRLADMNGDGLEDLVRLSPGSVLWWPGLGHGRFGEECPAGITRASPIAMVTPRDIGAAFDTTYLADLDGDGASDLVRLGDDTLEVWFNEGGAGFSRRSSIDGLRWSRDLDSAVRFVDVDGSGTVDVLFARARSFEWVDPMGGQRHRLLTEVDNGLGALTALTYGTSAQDYLRDLSVADACSGEGCETFLWQGRDDGQCDARVEAATGECAVRSSGTPAVSTVVRTTTTTDRLDVLGAAVQLTRDEYAYHDGYYEGIEQELRGFAATDVRAIGGLAQGTSLSRTWMHQGRRPRSIAADRLAMNPWESLKGRTYLAEQWDEASGRYVATTHTTFLIRKLVTGLDGREVTWALPARTDTIRYDLMTAWTPAPRGTRLGFAGGGDEYPAVVREVVGTGGTVSLDSAYPGWSEPVYRRSTGRHAIVAGTVDRMDHAGHVLEQTAWGRVKGEWDEPIPPEEVVSHSVPVLLDPQEWIWRTSETWTSGHGSTERLGWTTNVFTPGRSEPTQVIAHVSIPRSYEFAGDADGSQAFVQAAEDLVTSFAYDGWGNVTRTCAGGDLSTDESQCLRLASVSHDPAYQQMVVGESLATDFDGTTLPSSAAFDRGLGVYSQVTDPRGAVSRFGYDGLGRVTYTRAPSVRGCEGTDRPSTLVRYSVTSSPTTQPLSLVETTSVLDCHDPGDVAVSRAYVDGLGRARVSLVRASPTTWVRSGLTQFTPRGQPYRAFGPAFLESAEPTLSAVLAPGPEASAYTGYDAFGRTIWAQPLGAETDARTWTYYGATQVKVCDPNHRDPAHMAHDTCQYVRTDGQDRTIDTILVNRSDYGMPDEHLRLWPTYRADGALIALERAQTEDQSPLPLARALIVSGRSVTRTFAVDSVGRRIASTDRDTDARRAGTTETNRSWRYLFNRVGDLVAVRDPRGCGQSFYYDRAGRLLGEDYVGCDESEPWGDVSDEEVPAGSIAMTVLSAPRSVEVRTHYDAYPFWAIDELTPPSWAASTTGLVTASSDRGGRSVVAYDERGLGGWTARQMAMLPEAPLAQSALTGPLPVVSPSGGYAPVPRVYDDSHTYVTQAWFDHAGRARSSVLPIDPDFAGPSAPLVGGRVAFDQRGLPSSVWLSIDGLERAILAEAAYQADGAMSQATWGDDAGGSRRATTTYTTYDARRRPARIEVKRDPTGAPTSERPLAAVSTVMDQSFEWDRASTLLAIRDQRLASEWPDGFRPQSVAMTHDALYRVTSAEYMYERDSGPTGEDLAVDYRDALERRRDADPMRSRTAPSVSEGRGSRVVSLTWDYDFLGNTTEWTDDLAAFHERSLDRITNGVTEAGGRPSAMRVATSIASSAHEVDTGVDRGGWLEIDYGDSGNVSAVTVHGQCHDVSASALCVDPASSSVATRRGALREGCFCEVEQHYQYRFDELNQIVDARRYDRGGSNDWSLAAHLRYGYDGANQRTVKEVRDAGTGPSRFAIWPYAGDFERRGLLRGLDGYEATLGTETSYMIGGARVVWQGTGPTGGLDPDHRVALPLPDLLGTSSAVIDLVTGELVESSTYYPNGARETVRATEAAEVPLEPAGFTGKEADEEVGLTYFGMRFLMPRLGRWASPDPLQIHAEGGGEMMNNYHYVSGNLLQARDPIGLDGGTFLGIPLEIPAPAAPGVPTAAPAAPAPAAAASPGLVTGVAYGVQALGPGVAILGTGHVFATRTGSTITYGNPNGAPGTDIAFPTLRMHRKINEPVPDLLPDPDADPDTDVPDDTAPDDERRRLPLLHLTYLRHNVRTNEFYAGRLSGHGTPQQLLSLARATPRHALMTFEGFGPLQLDRLVPAALPYGLRHDDPAYQAIRGREQQLIDIFGGAWSHGRGRGGPHILLKGARSVARNKIRGVGPENRRGRTYHDAATVEFGELAPYTGDDPGRVP